MISGKIRMAVGWRVGWSVGWRRRGGITLLGVVMLAAGLTGGAMAGGIGNLVYRDQNANRIYDLGDMPVAGVTLHLYGAGKVPGTDQPVAVTSTDPEGHYLFSGVADGSYFVFIVPTAFTAGGALMNSRSVPGTLGAAGSDDDGGEDGIDSAQPTSQGVRSGTIVLAAGQAPVSTGTETGSGNESDDAADAETDLTVDFGFEGFTTRVGDFVWLDENRDGLQDAGEPGVANVQVQLFDVSDGFMGATLTAPDGYYTFTGVAAGIYYLRFPTVLFPLVLTTAEQDPSDQRDSDAAVATGRTPDFTVANLENQILRDAGYVVDRPDIGDYVFADLNADGVQDPGEDGISGVTVELYTAAGAMVVSAQSDATGRYLFPEVVPGNYFLQFPTTTADGLVLAAADQAADDINDSDPDPATGRTPVFTAAGGQDDVTRDAGYHAPPASISGLAWHDLDKDGVRDPGEPVLAGVAVALLDGNTNEPVTSTVTDALGTYQFTGLDAVPWLVEFTRYAGTDQRYQLTLEDLGGDDTLDSDAAVLDGRTGAVIPVNGEQIVFDAGYRNVRLGLGNGVFKDADGNGTFNAGEGMAGVTVQLFQAEDDPLTGPARATTVTSSPGGTYYFLDLVPGQYFVRIPASQFSPGGPLEGWVSRPGDGLDDGVDDTVGENGHDAAYPAASGIRSNTVTLTTGGEPVTAGGTENGRERTADTADDANIDLTVDFGFIPGMALGNLVYADSNRNGGYDAGEGGRGCGGLSGDRRARQRCPAGQCHHRCRRLLFLPRSGPRQLPGASPGVQFPVRQPAGRPPVDAGPWHCSHGG